MREQTDEFTGAGCCPEEDGYLRGKALEREAEGARVYVDDAFVGGEWGKWTGGGHMQADSPEALHAFAAKLGLKRAWFQSRPGRPERDHYDLTASKRDQAILFGAIPEAVEDGTARRKAVRDGG